MRRDFNQVKTVLLLLTLTSLAASLYLAHLSGRAMSAAVGDTFDSLNLAALSTLAGFPAMIFGGSLLVAEQKGGGLIRITKGIVTFVCWFHLQVLAAVVIQRVSAP